MSDRDDRPLTLDPLTLDVTVTLLEDLHTGSGLGVAGVIDAGLARDADGVPYFPYSGFRNLVRDACRRLTRLAPGRYDADLAEALFDEDGRRGMAATFTHLRPEGEVRTTIHTQTAIDHERGVANDKTLRARECLARGQCLRGSISVPYGGDAARDLLVDAGRLTRTLGGGRRRGLGLVRIDMEEAEAPEVPPPPSGFEGARVVLRVIARATEPLSLQLGEQAVNTLATLDHVPGATLLGWLRHVWRMDRTGGDQHAAAGNALASEGLSCGALLPLPDDDDDTDTLPVPAPLSLVRPKRTGGDGLGWGRATVPDEFADLCDVTFTPPPARAKPLAPGAWVVATDGGARLYRPRRESQMRNRTDPRSQATTEDGLYAVQSIARGTRFVGEIVFDGPDAADRAEALVAWGGSKLGAGAVVRVGRGKRPLVIESVTDATERVEPRGATGRDDTIVLTLRSPLALRDRWGGFVHEFGVEDLRAALQDAGLAAKLASAIVDVRASDVGFVVRRGFHYGGLPSFPRGGLAAGSVLVLTVAPKRRDALRDGLATAGRGGIGACRAIGWGRFAVDHPVHAGSEQPSPRARVLDAVDSFVADPGAGAAKISRTQWSWLASRVPHFGANPANGLDELFESRRKTEAGKVWAGSARRALAGALEAFDAAADQTLFLTWVCHRMRARAPEEER